MSGVDAVHHEATLAEKVAAKKKPSSLGAKKGTGLGSGGKKGTAPPKKPASYAGAMSFASIGQKVSAPKKAAYAAAFEESDSD